MKNLKLFVLFFSIILTGNCYSQSGWFWQNPLPFGHTFHSVRFINTQTGFAVGMSGMVVRSTNGGIDWDVIRKNTNEEINSLFIIDSNTFIAVGSPGLVLRSSDSGNNWGENYIAMNDINEVFFINQNTGFITGTNTVMKTSNGGINWFSPAGDLSKVVTGIYFVNDNTGWISANYFAQYYFYSEILKTTNGGINWGIQYHNQVSTNSQTRALFFINQFTGWCYPNLKTTNGGTNWIIENPQFEDIFFVNEFKGWKVNSISNSISKTINSGNDWNQIVCGTNKIINTSFLDSLNGYSVGYYGTTLKSVNGGSNWLKISTGERNDFLNISISDENYVWCSDLLGNIQMTSNSGSTWSSSFSGDSSSITDFQFINKYTGYLVNSSGKLMKSIDGGLSWSTKDSMNYSTKAVSFLNKDTGYFGDFSRIKKTTNGGSNWQIISIPEAAIINDIFFLNQETGWVAAFHIYKTTNSGLNWTRKYLNYENYFRKIFFVNENCGWVLKHLYAILRTTNSGTSWDTSYFNYTNNINAMFFWDSMHGIIAGGRSLYGTPSIDIIMKTGNGGLNWSPLTTISNEHKWQDIKFINNSGTGWLVGNGGAILKTTNFGGDPIGIVNLANDLPYNFSLSQNYPNPFNPHTKIKFDIPAIVRGQTSNVKLIIYDVLGREVTTLVDEELKPGTYEADWDGSNFSSGVYFYKLISNDFVETKKMVLMK